MSYRLFDWAMDITDLKPANKLLLLALAHCCNGKTGAATCWPSQTRLSELTGLSERAIRYGLRELEARRLIATTPGSGRTSTRYRLACQDSPNGRLDLPDPAVDDAAQRRGGGARGAARKRTSPMPQPPPGDGAAGHVVPPNAAAAGHSVPPWAASAGQALPPCGATAAGSGAPGAAGTGKEQGREPGDPERAAGPAARAPAHGATGAPALTGHPGPRWRAIADSVRPDLVDAAAVRRKFEAYHRNATFADQAEADRAWEMWLLREHSDRFKRYTRPLEAAEPGAFLAGLGSPNDDLHADYQVMSDD